MNESIKSVKYSKSLLEEMFTRHCLWCCRSNYSLANHLCWHLMCSSPSGSTEHCVHTLKMSKGPKSNRKQLHLQGMPCKMKCRTFLWLGTTEIQKQVPFKSVVLDQLPSGSCMQGRARIQQVHVQHGSDIPGLPRNQNTALICCTVCLALLLFLAEEKLVKKCVDCSCSVRQHL